MLSVYRKIRRDHDQNYSFEAVQDFLEQFAVILYFEY